MNKTLANVLESIGWVCEYIVRERIPLASVLLSEFNRLKKVYVSAVAADDSMSQRLKIALAGRFSTGKSSFINSFLGECVAKEGEGTTTHCRTVFQGDPGVKGIRIVDNHGRSYMVTAYQEKCANPDFANLSFTVTVPNLEFAGLSIIDMPGYDPQPSRTAERDKEISKQAVDESDVVFFLVKISDGTIVANNGDYLKRVGRKGKHLYIILSRADDKQRSGRAGIIETVRNELKNLAIAYDGLLPYTALSELELRVRRKRNEQNLFELISYRQKLIDLLTDIQKRRETLRVKHFSARDREMADGLRRYSRRLLDHLQKSMRAFRAERDVFDVNKVRIQLIERIGMEYARHVVDLKLVTHEDIPDSGWVVDDKRVFLKDLGARVELPEDRKRLLMEEVHRILAPCGTHFVKLKREVLDEAKRAAQDVCKDFVASDRYVYRVGWESECEEKEELIKTQFGEDFPMAFKSAFGNGLRRKLNAADSLRRDGVKGARIYRQMQYDMLFGMLFRAQKDLEKVLKEYNDDK